jgi:hypothetical protein
MRRTKQVLLILLMTPLLSGCFLIAGEQASNDNTPDGGNVYVTLVSADGSEVRSVPTEFRDQPLGVFVSARSEQGQLRIEVLNPDDSVVFVVDAQPSEQYNDGTVLTNTAGKFRYRIRATGAQNGEFQILYQPGE